MEFTIKEENGFKFIDEGEGEVLILLHGLMGALSNWTDVGTDFTSKTFVVKLADV